MSLPGPSEYWVSVAVGEKGKGGSLTLVLSTSGVHFCASSWLDDTEGKMVKQPLVFWDSKSGLFSQSTCYHPCVRVLT